MVSILGFFYNIPLASYVFFRESEGILREKAEYNSEDRSIIKHGHTDLFSFVLFEEEQIHSQRFGKG